MLSSKLAGHFLGELRLVGRELRAGLKRGLKRARREVGGIDRALIEEHFSGEKTRKLHIGSGIHPLSGWLNSDYEPSSEGVLFLDATELFPFEDASLDYIFSEHMIEHIPYAAGIHMLGECLRVLKRGGKIRISTPDLHFLIDLFREDKSALQSEYIKWSTQTFRKDAPYSDATFVMNNFVRDWGHQFIYDERALRHSLESVGFSDIVCRELNESDDSELRGLENEDRMPRGFLKLESFTLEATKP